MSRKPRRQRGQALVEFALVLPIFVLLLFALLDLGRVVFAQNTVSQASREAARFAALEHSEAKALWPVAIIVLGVLLLFSSRRR